MLNLLSDHEDPRNWWTSGADLGREGNWFLSTNLQPVETFVWGRGNNIEPDQCLLEANCLSLWSGFGYKGADEPCSKSYFPVCQRK